MVAVAAASRVAVVLVAILAAQACAHGVQVGLVGEFHADKFLLSKASDFDHETPKQWMVTGSLDMKGNEAWLAFFTVNPGDAVLEVDRDGQTATIPLNHNTEESQSTGDTVKITLVEVGGEPMALVQVPGHFKDVWRTFHENCQAILGGDSAKPHGEWEGALTAAWKSAWRYWNTDRVYTLMFAQGLGVVGARHSVKILMKGQEGEQEVERQTPTSAAWFATSIPRSGSGSASFWVRVDSRETEERMLEDTPSRHAARCTRLKPKEASDNLVVFVAAFSNKRTFDSFEQQVLKDMKTLWVPESGTWLFDEITEMCLGLHVTDGSGPDGGGGGAAGREDLFLNPVGADGNWDSSVAEEDVGASLLMAVCASSVASTLLLVVVWWFFCRGGDAHNKSDDFGTSNMEAPDIHGDVWDIDGASDGLGGVGGLARERCAGDRGAT